MSQVVSMVEAKSRLAELVGQVKFGGKQYILDALPAHGDVN